MHGVVWDGSHKWVDSNFTLRSSRIEILHFRTMRLSPFLDDSCFHFESISNFSLTNPISVCIEIVN